MFSDQSEDLHRGGALPMPPVSSQPGIMGSSIDGNGRLTPPFAGHPTTTPRQVEAEALIEENEPAWDSLGDGDEGTVEPVFEADVSETEAVLAELSKNARSEEEFPLDAFIIPEQAQRVPTGLDANAGPSQRTQTPVTDLADRLEKLSHRLRVEESEAVVTRLAAGDRLDTLLAGLLAGYLSASK